jgi:ribosomal protein S12 methylthiotransferase
VASHPNICPYFDIHIQHASPEVLRRMGRRYGTQDLYRLFEDIRSRVKDASLRTTVIVGFPGEGRGDFDRLVEFVNAVRFDHLGVFVYSDSEDLPSHRLGRHVTPKTAHRRRERLMEIQADISLETNRSRIGEAFDVLIERKAAGGRYRGRTMRQAPEVDGVTLVRKNSGGGLSPGQIVRVKITGADDYDLEGVCEQSRPPCGPPMARRGRHREKPDAPGR